MQTAAAYYAGTERSYRALCPERSGHMNMGYWPAPSLRAAQELLIADAIEHLLARNPALRTVVDAGSGWGGTAALFRALAPTVSYTGVNLSQPQLAAAAARSGYDNKVRFVCSDITRFVEHMEPADALVSIEAAFHFERRAELIRALRGKVRDVVLLELCVEDERAIRANPLLNTALGQAWPLARYRREFAAAGFGEPEIVDVSDRTFCGFADYLSAWDQTRYDESRAVLRQFRRAFRDLAQAAERGALRYLRLSWRAT